MLPHNICMHIGVFPLSLGRKLLHYAALPACCPGFGDRCLHIVILVASCFCYSCSPCSLKEKEGLAHSFRDFNHHTRKSWWKQLCSGWQEEPTYILANQKENCPEPRDKYNLRRSAQVASPKDCSLPVFKNTSGEWMFLIQATTKPSDIDRYINKFYAIES